MRPRRPPLLNLAISVRPAASFRLFQPATLQRSTCQRSSPNFSCHTSEKSPTKSNHCHTSEKPLPQVLCLPHIQEPPGGCFAVLFLFPFLPACSVSLLGSSVLLQPSTSNFRLLTFFFDPHVSHLQSTPPGHPTSVRVHPKALTGWLTYLESTLTKNGQREYRPTASRFTSTQ